MEEELKAIIRRLYSALTNKYISTALFFIVWISFIDRNDLFVRMEYHQKLSQIYKDQEYYIKEIEQLNLKLEELNTNTEQLETFARETYYMKKKNEDIYVIERVKESEKSFSFFGN